MRFVGWGVRAAGPKPYYAPPSSSSHPLPLIPAGSPGLKCYHSFIRPREATLQHAREEALAPAARRTAAQVAFLTRRTRAELTDYVRNHDQAASERLQAGVVLQPLVLVLDNVRSAYNVGSILRTAETAGVSLVVTCGLTPTPPHEKLR